MYPDESSNLKQVMPSIDPSMRPPSLSRNKVFFGRFGIRAAWSSLIYVVLAILLAQILTVIALAATGHLKQAVANRSASSHASKVTASQAVPDMVSHVAFMSEILEFGGFAFAALVLARIERRRFGVYGIGLARLTDVIPGALSGFIALSLLIVILRTTHHLVFELQVLHGSAVVIFGVKWLFAFLAVGLLEEYSCRGFLQFTLTRGFYGLAERISPTNARAIAFSVAALLMSIFFSATHLLNAHETPMGIVMIFLVAILFSYALWRTGSLWWAIGYHMTWDWAESFLYGVPDSGRLSAGRLFHTHALGNPLLSGGIDGPEGSVYAIPVLIVAFLAIRLTTRVGAHPPLQQETRLPELANLKPLGLMSERETV